MALFLLVLGAAVAAAGFVLAAAGVILPEGTFSAEVVTPGTIAAVGGLMLVGMGLAVRQLQRIERALTARPAPRVALPKEETESPAAKPAVPPVRPPKLAAGASPPPTPLAASPLPPEVAPFAMPPATSSAARVERVPVVGEAGMSLMLQTPLHADEEIPEVREVAAMGRGGTGIRPMRPAPRVVAKARQASAPEVAKGAVFNAVWPTTSRGGIQVTSVEIAELTTQPPTRPLTETPQVAAAVSEVPPAAPPAGVEPVAAAPVSILKSGVVEGMAYTLYADGSIEAQLPQGTMRFGSIAALRDHIEGGA
jgi:hypothetical protein